MDYLVLALFGSPHYWRLAVLHTLRRPFPSLPSLWEDKERRMDLGVPLPLPRPWLGVFPQPGFKGTVRTGILFSVGCSRPARRQTTPTTLAQTVCGSAPFPSPRALFLPRLMESLGRAKREGGQPSYEVLQSADESTEVVSMFMGLGGER